MKSSSYHPQTFLYIMEFRSLSGPYFQESINTKVVGVSKIFFKSRMQIQQILYRNWEPSNRTCRKIWCVTQDQFVFKTELFIIVLMIITQVSGKTSNLACTVKNLGNQTVIRSWSTCHDYHDDHDDHHDHHHYHDEEVHGGDRHEYNDVEALSLEYRQCVNFWLKSFEPLIFQQTKFIRTRLWAPINIFEELFAYFVQ